MRRFRDLPIARKLVISMLLTSSLALLMATVGFTAHHVVEFRRSLITRISSLADTLGATSAGALAFEDTVAAQRILAAVEGQTDIVMACLYTPQGALLAGWERATTACPGDAEGFAGSEDGTLRHLTAVDYEGDRVGLVGLVAGQQALWASLSDYAVIVAVLLVVAFGAAWGLAAILQHLIAAPVLHLVSVAQSVKQRRDYSMRAALAAMMKSDSWAAHSTTCCTRSRRTPRTVERSATLGPIGTEPTRPTRRSRSLSQT